MGSLKNQHVPHSVATGEISDWLATHINKHIEQRSRKEKISAEQTICRVVEEIEEKKRLKALSSEDYDL